MKLHFLAYFTDEVRIEAIQYITHVLKLFEVAFLVLHFIDFVRNADNFLFNLLVICKIVLAEFDELSIFAN